MAIECQVIAKDIVVAMINKDLIRIEVTHGDHKKTAIDTAEIVAEVYKIIVKAVYEG